MRQRQRTIQVPLGQFYADFILSEFPFPLRLTKHSVFVEINYDDNIETWMYGEYFDTT